MTKRSSVTHKVILTMLWSSLAVAVLAGTFKSWLLAILGLVLLVTALVLEHVTTE